MRGGPSPHELAQMCQHTLDQNGQPVSPVGSLFYNVRARQDFMTATIQPPLLAWAWLAMEMVDPDRSARSSHIPMQVAS